MKMLTFQNLFIFLLILVSVKADAVCTESTLVTELIQDILDNNKLDCLRVPLEAPSDRIETEDEKKLRLEGMWDTDCAFEAEYDWIKPLKENYGLKTGLVDVNGKPVENDFEDQADMCEIVRAIINGGLLEGAKLSELTPSVVDGLDCPGEGELGQSEICAVSGGAGSQNYAWNILLYGLSITATRKPKWEFTPESQKKLDAKKND